LTSWNAPVVAAACGWWPPFTLRTPSGESWNVSVCPPERRLFGPHADPGSFVPRDERKRSNEFGWGKSTAISFAFSYMIYLLSCLESPAEYFGLMRGSEVFLINQSVNLTLAKKVLFGEIKAKIKQSPYFRQHFPPGPFESQLVFPKNVTVLPLASGDTSALGLNVFGGCIDEINFQPKVRGGTRSRSVNEVYDAGKKMFDAIYRRLKSRFMKTGGFIPGKVMVVSSSQYEDDFTENMRRQARTDRTIFFRSHSLWESRTDLQSDTTFKVEIGGALGRPRILTGDESPCPQNRRARKRIHNRFDATSRLELRRGPAYSSYAFPVSGTRSRSKWKSSISKETVGPTTLPLNPQQAACLCRAPPI
jgi:hypothetical protein